jgi:prepilin-type N-terminal cleavage/methylation domain-containing protein
MKPDSANLCKVGRQSGFTLLELLVVVAFLGLLIIGLTQGLRAGLTLWDAQSRRTGETAELDAAARVLRTLVSGDNVFAIRQLRSRRYKFPGTQWHRRQSLFYWLPTGFGTTQRADVTLMASRGQLVLRWTPTSPRSLHRARTRAHRDRTAWQRRPSRACLLGLASPAQAVG